MMTEDGCVMYGFKTYKRLQNPHRPPARYLVLGDPWDSLRCNPPGVDWDLNERFTDQADCRATRGKAKNAFADIVYMAKVTQLPTITVRESDLAASFGLNPPFGLVPSGGWTPPFGEEPSFSLYGSIR